MKKVCEICGKEKPLSEFSKSYKNRCKECVAEITRENRHAKKIYREEMNQLMNKTRLPNVVEFDFSIDWEKRRYEIAKDMLAAFMSNSNSNVFGGSKENQAKDAVKYADALIAELQKKGE